MKGKQLCAICGVMLATTRDHLPPRQMFAKPYPKNLITVPACHSCNNRGSRYDESFIAMLGVHLGRGDNLRGQRLFTERTVKTLRHNRRLGTAVLGNAKPVEIRTPAGIFVEKAYAILWDSKAHTEVISRLVRGLYYHHFGEIIGSRVVIKTYWFRDLSDPIYKATLNLKQCNVGDDFIYRYGRAEGHPLHSLWVFQFYDGHWAGGFTSPSEDTELNGDSS